MNAKVKTFILSILLSACASTQQTAPTGADPRTYMADIQLTVSNVQFDGMAVTKLTAAGVTVKIDSPITMDTVRISSCAREDIYNAQGTSMQYSYVPVPQELEGMCPLFVEALSKKDLMAWGLVGFRSDEDAASHDYLNGTGIKFAGFSVGQSKAGLEQSTTFPQKMKYVADANCVMTTTDNMTFKFSPTVGVCHATWVYKDSAGIAHWHRLLFNAYDQVFLR